MPRDERALTFFERLDSQLELIHQLARGIQLLTCGGLFCHQPVQRLVIFLRSLQIETRAREIGIDFLAFRERGRLASTPAAGLWPPE